ncbi:MAG: serine hydrolase [Myxococcota bacterium]
MMHIVALLALAGVCDRTPLAEILGSDPRLSRVLESPDTYRAQILVRELGPCANRRAFRESAEYFYPASAIKIVAAIGALRWAEEHGVDLREEIVVGAGVPMTIQENLERTLVVSSNPGFNWLYDVAGVERMHRLLWRSGYRSVRMRHRFGPRAYPRSEQRIAPEVRRGNGEHVTPRRTMVEALPPNVGARTSIGHAHIEPSTQRRVSHPMPFAGRNGMTLADLQAVLIDIIHPEAAPSPLPLSEESRQTLRGELSRVVDEAPPAGAPPDRVRYKPLLAGVRRGVRDPAQVHVESKAGRAYGFLVDNGYYRYGRRELFIAAVVYVNSNGVIGDDTYEYNTTGLAFFEALGEALAREVFTAR